MSISYAPAKAILFGEHAVVYGEPAIAIPIHSVETQASFVSYDNSDQNGFKIISPNINMNTSFENIPIEHPLKKLCLLLQDIIQFKHFPEKALVINSTIPIASGLGSSAASSVAVIKAFSEEYNANLTTQGISDIAFEIERIYHGHPSGIDNTVVSYNQPVYFKKGSPFSKIDLHHQLNLIIAYTGIHSKTSDSVEEVRKHFDEYKEFIHDIGLITDEGKSALLDNNIQNLGNLMYKNHMLLQKIDVSCSELDRLVEAAIAHGAVGAKLTGSGRGGNIIALSPSKEKNAEIADALLNAGAKFVLC